MKHSGLSWGDFIEHWAGHLGSTSAIPFGLSEMGVGSPDERLRLLADYAYGSGSVYRLPPEPLQEATPLGSLPGGRWSQDDYYRHCRRQFIKTGLDDDLQGMLSYVQPDTCPERQTVLPARPAAQRRLFGRHWLITFWLLYLAYSAVIIFLH